MSGGLAEHLICVLKTDFLETSLYIAKFVAEGIRTSIHISDTLVLGEYVKYFNFVFP